MCMKTKSKKGFRKILKSFFNGKENEDQIKKSYSPEISVVHAGN